MLKARDWLDKATIRALSVRASVDPRTIVRVIEGRPVRGMAGQRALAALIESGVLPPGGSENASETAASKRDEGTP
jgi:hypothetical protein